MTGPRLRALATLAEARQVRDLAVLEGLAAEDRRLAAELAGLAGLHARDVAEEGPLPLLDRRLRWAEARAAAIRAARAALAPRIAAARAAAALALGKREALDRLARRAEAEARARLEAREEHDRPPRPPG